MVTTSGTTGEPYRGRLYDRVMLASGAGGVASLGRAAGCELTTLNATPEGELLYRQLGFRFVGVAQTWWR